MKTLKVETSTRVIVPQCVVVDQGGMLHSSLYWPKQRVVMYLVNRDEQYLGKILEGLDMDVIFDRHYEKSIKSDTRLSRIGSFCRSHQLSTEKASPPKDMCL